MDFFAELTKDLKSGKLGFTVAPPSEVGAGDSLYKGEAQFKLAVIAFASVYLQPTVEDLKKNPSSILSKNPKSVGVYGRGSWSSGKSQMFQTAASLFPATMFRSLTDLSDKDLYYLARDDPHALSRSIVYFEEANAISEKLQLTLRILLSKGRTTHSTVIGRKHHELTIFGPISLASTGIDEKLRKDTLSRMIVLDSDESVETTQKFVCNRLDAASTEPNPNEPDAAEKYRDFWKNIKPYYVILPKKLTDELKDLISANCEKVEVRRALEIFLALLCTIALINQTSRTKSDSKEILWADLEDYDILYPLLETQNIFMRESHLSPSERRVLNLVISTSALADQEFNRKQIQDILKMPRQTANAALLSLSNQGFLECLDRKGSGATSYYRLSHGETSNWMGLPSPNKLRDLIAERQVSLLIKETAV